MAQRRFGPVLGAGVGVIEKDGDKLIQPASLGNAVLFGKTRKGDTDKLLHCPTRADTLKKIGDYVDGSELPNAAFDFWNLGQGRGELFVVRITDGTEVEAFESYFSRHSGHGYRYGVLADATWNDKKRSVAKITAKNGGRWGGRQRVLTGSVAVVGTDVTATTVTTGVAMTLNAFAGGYVRLKGVTSKTYPILSNTAAGIVTVASDSTMAVDLAAGGDPTNADYELVLDTEVQTFPTSRAGTRRALSVVWKNGEENESDLFGLDVFEDEELVYSQPNLSMDPANKWFAENVINEDTSNFWISFEDLFVAGTYSSDIRPANFSGVAQDWASEVVTVPIAHVRSQTSVNATAGWVGNFTLPSPARVKKQRITITFTAATTFNVATDIAEGSKHLNLPSGTVGTAYVADNRHTIGFTVFLGQSAWTAADTIVIDVLPLPVDDDGEGLLTGHHLYYDTDSDPRARKQIKSNTSNTITLVSAPDTPPDENTAATDVLNTGTLVFPLTLTDTAIEIIHSSFGLLTVTIAAGPHATAADLAAAINTGWQTATTGLGDIAAASVTPADSVDIALDDSGTDTEKGYESFLIIGTNANAELNLAAGDHIIGTIGAGFRVQAPTELRGGFDGQDPADADFTTAMLPANESLISRLFGQNKGLVKLACPGKTSTVIQQTLFQLAEAYSYQARYEVPAATTDDSAAVAYINDTLGRNDFALGFFPSYAYVPNPIGSGVVLKTLTGAFLGREALVAANHDGYQKVPAGVDVTLPNIVRLPTGDRILNEEILNPVGLNVVKKLRGNFVMWGARTISLDPNWKFRQQRELMSHYERIFLEQLDFLVFAINNPSLQSVALTTLRAFFEGEFAKGAILGDKLEDAVVLVSDGSNNTALSRAAGDLNVSASMRLAETAERVILTLSKAGVFEG